MSGLIKAPKSVLEQLEARCPGVGVERLTKIMEDSYDLYVEQGRSDHDLAVLYPDVPRAVIRSLIKEFRWPERRREHLEQIKVAADIEYVNTVLATRTKTAKQIVDEVGPVMTKLMTKVSEALDNDDTIAVRRYAESFGQIGGILMKASGVDGTPLLAAELEKAKDGKGDGKPSWSINASGPVTIVQDKEKEPEPKTVDVDEG